MRHRYFVVIDEETIKTLFDAPELRKGSTYLELTCEDDEHIIIKIVEVGYDESCEGIIFGTASRQPTKGTSDCVTFYGDIKPTPMWLLIAWVYIIS